LQKRGGSQKPMSSGMIKAVLDTNVFISALFWKGAPYEIVRRGLGGAFVIVVSDAIIVEVKNTLVRKFNFPAHDAEAFSEIIIFNSMMIKPALRLDVVDIDPSDNKIFECAVAGGANYIVSGDKHILGFRRYRGIEVVTPNQFLRYAL